MTRRDVRDGNFPAVHREPAVEWILREEQRRIEVREIETALPRRETRRDRHREDALDVAAALRLRRGCAARAPARPQLGRG